jgi:sulfide:quinone oxidoreductase
MTQGLNSILKKPLPILTANHKSQPETAMQHFDVLVIGGGNAGLSVASRIRSQKPQLKVGIIEPSDKHYYQPAWTLVGGGDFNIADTIKAERDFIPDGAVWIKDEALQIDPEQQSVTTGKSGLLKYDWLVAAPGIQLDWHKVDGLTETLGLNGVTSNYLPDYAPYTWKLLQGMRSGKAIFTSPGTPIKCGGAPQKIMYLAGDYFRRQGLKDHVNIEFCTAGGVIFGIKKYADTLMKAVRRYGIDLHFKHELIRVDGPARKAWFRVMDADGNASMVEKEFDMLHVVPPQSAPDFIKQSPLAVQDNPLGWIEVDKHTLRHVRFPRVFALGDATNTPNAKTGAAVRKQAPVLVANLLSAMEGKALTAQYDGYGSCPLITGYGKLVLAEFNYTNEPTETFPFDQSKERWSMYQLKKRVLPWLYWNRILQGRM